MHKEACELWRQERNPEASRKYEKLIGMIDRDSYWYPEILGQYYCTLVATKRFDKAEEVASMRLEACVIQGNEEGSPEVAQARLGLAELYLKINEFEKAIDICRNGLAGSDSALLLLYHPLVTACLKPGLQDSAKSALKDALALAEQHGKPAAYFSRLYEELKGK